MANGISFSAKIETDNIDAVKDAAKDQLYAAFNEIALTAQSYAVLRCPVDTGNLRGSIDADATDNRAIIGTNVEYAPYVELGTSKMDEQPFLRPAIENHLDYYKSILEEHLKD